MMHSTLPLNGLLDTEASLMGMKVSSIICFFKKGLHDAILVT